MAHFVAVRAKLPPDAFALGPEKDPDPTDPVDQPTWAGIVHLPDDVSLRTAEHHGSVLKSVYDLWGNWVSLVLDVQALQREPANGPLAAVMLDAGDEIQASTYAALTGVYRQAIGGLRAVVEGMLTGAYFRALPDPQRFDEWLSGGREGQMWVRDMRQKLASTMPYEQFELPDRSLMAKDGWINDLPTP